MCPHSLSSWKSIQRLQASRKGDLERREAIQRSDSSLALQERERGIDLLN